MNMAQFIDYNKVIDQAMRGIVKKCLKFVEKRGGKLPGNHHFYITFDLSHKGVKISPALAKTHKDQMTIVIQHQFWDLTVEDAKFSIVLSFNNVREKIEIPYDALISFADPSARFGLQFHSEDDLVVPDDEDISDEELFQALLDLDDTQDTGMDKKKAAERKAKVAETNADGSSKIISIDSFRKK
jgi:hypothetical protein